MIVGLFSRGAAAKISSSAAVGLFLALAFGAPAQAQTLNRAWVSGHGADAAGCGAPANPCRSLQYVHDNIIAAGGEIDILDPAGYGAITITKALSIVNDGVGAAGVQQPTSGLDAITINAGANDAIILRGLEINGLDTARFGVNVLSAGSLTIANCVVERFGGPAGIVIEPSGGLIALVATDIAVSSNDLGVVVQPTGSGSVSGVIKKAMLANNVITGLQVNGGLTSGAVDLTVIDSVATLNPTAGFDIENPGAATNTTVFLDNVVATDNGSGLHVAGSAVARLQRSSFTKNNIGVQLGLSGSGAAQSFQDNAIYGNASDVSGLGVISNVTLK
ncbi:right-handed parallel beta-helix repeat-containing protein [Methylocapsa sp. S129]|uniref:right-handed parallel beta-helix repeat-containing protein n=1 Tax=Methylocapsa sp. S129 TaxID=1641869 RepID=UPI00131DC800|nr:right-handed parallel beta-helix repeat-containing protein [Methylocapsa sp. S129]